jgi:hypothetical protein
LALNPEENVDSGPAGEAAAETKPAAGAVFAFTSFKEFLKFVAYVGDDVQIEFAEPVLDSAGAALVQKGVHMRATLQKSLQQFFDRGNLNENIIIADAEALHSALRERICRTLFRCLDVGRFHVAQALVDASQINIQGMLSNVVARRDFLPVLLKLDQSEDPILPHLGEVALVAAGLAEQYCRYANTGAATREIVRYALIGGLLHDIALTDDADFLLNDIEKIAESAHASRSATQAKQLLPDLPAEITDIIEHHHRTGTPYDPETDSRLSPQAIAGEALALAEYIFVQLRSQYKKDEKMNSAELLFYDLGRAFGQGRFHPQFKRIAARLWEKLFATLHYGFEIGAVENQCPKKPSAIAYPTPRCTQIMCHRHVANCEYFDAQFPLEVLHATRFPGRPGVMIDPGKYGKCRLAAKLPKGINEKLTADAWLKQSQPPESGEAGA